MTGPSGYWCRACGRYQSTRTRASVTTAKAHTAAHMAAGEQPRDGRPWTLTPSTPKNGR